MIAEYFFFLNFFTYLGTFPLFSITETFRQKNRAALKLSGCLLNLPLSKGRRLAGPVPRLSGRGA